MKKQILKGRLDLFWETGCEAVGWAFYEDGKKGYDALHTLEKGDLLTVYNKAAKKIWQGTIDFDYDSHKQKRPLIGEVQWLEEIGHIDGVQKGIPAKKWADMFLSKCRAELTVSNPHP